MMAGRRRSPAPSGDSNEDAPGRQGAGQPAKSKKPANTAFRQQRLRAWQPVLTPRTIIVVWSILAVVLLAVGGILYWLSSTVQDFQLDYTDCLTAAGANGTFETMSPNLITSHFKTSQNESDPLDASIAEWSRSQFSTQVDGVNTVFNQCTINFNIPNDMSPPVLMFYRLENFYQNHRRYVNSFNAQQLLGQAVDGGTLNGSMCSQLAYEGGKIIFPCGLIANSMFNDTFSSPVLLNPQNTADHQITYVMENSTDIAWSSDANLYGDNTSYPLDQITPPPNWGARYPNGYTTSNPPPNLKAWPQFQNWMRTAATADFTKPYQRNDTAPMTRGQYQIVIADNFNVTGYNGRKYLVFSTINALGGRNPWVGVIFLVTGGFCLIMTIVFTAGHLFKPRKMGDHTYLSWNNAPTATATATGADVGRGVGVRQR